VNVREPITDVILLPVPLSSFGITAPEEMEVLQPGLDSVNSSLLIADDPNQHYHKTTRNTREQNDTVGTEMLAELEPTVPASVERVPQQEVEIQCDPSISDFAFRRDARQRKERQNVETAPATTCSRSRGIQDCKMV
jgi:hypothetical protein